MSISEPLDPKRPWITDPDDLPTGGITLRTLISPFGDSAQVPFKRAYMIIFLLSIPFAFMLFLAAVGGGNAIMPLGVLGVLSIFLLIAHVRRLNHAGRNPLLAGLVVLPAVLGFAIFAAVAPPHVQKANEILAQMEADRADPKAAAERRAASAKKARESGQAAGGGNAQRGRQGGPGGPGGAQTFSPAGYVMSKASGWPARAAFPVWLFVTLWSLMWVARLPKAKRS